MTTPAKMQTPETIADQLVSHWNLTRPPIETARAYLADAFRERDAQHAAQPRVSKRPRSYVEQIAQRSARQGDSISITLELIAKAAGLVWPVETVAENDAYALQHDPNKPKETTMEHDPMKPEPPDMSGLPGWEIEKWRIPLYGEWVTTSGEAPWRWLLSPTEYTPTNPLWILRRRTEPAPPASDEAEVERIARKIYGYAWVPGQARWPQLDAGVRESCMSDARSFIADLRKPVDLDAVASAIDSAVGEPEPWEEMLPKQQDMRRRQARAVLAFLCVPIAEKPTPTINPQSLRDLAEALEKNHTIDFGKSWAMLREAAAEIERLRKEPKV